MQAVTQQPVGNKSIFAIIQSIIDNCNGITLVKINNRIKITPMFLNITGIFDWVVGYFHVVIAGYKNKKVKDLKRPLHKYE